MIPLLRPAETVQTIHDIDFGRLRSLGKQVLLFDFDGTLARRGSSAMPSASNILLADLTEMGFRVAILTNRRSHRVIADVQLPVIYYARKPRRKGYLAVLHRLSSEPTECAMIGDRCLTDILGGNRLGIHTIRVRRHPIHEIKTGPMAAERQP